MTEETSYEEWVAQAMPEWAKELQESFRALLTRNFALSLEVDRLRHNEEIHERNNEEFDGWADEFFKANGLDHLIKSYHDFIISKIDEDCDGDEEND